MSEQYTVNNFSAENISVTTFQITSFNVRIALQVVAIFC